MTWTYTGTPGTSTAAELRDYVRLNIGDTDTNYQQITDEEITAALATANNDPFNAAALIARALAAKYARQSDVMMGEGAFRIDASAISKAYMELAKRLETQAKKNPTSLSVGIPAAGGLTYSEIDSYEEDSDWNQPRFKEGQFGNPPRDATNERDV